MLDWPMFARMIGLVLLAWVLGCCVSVAIAAFFSGSVGLREVFAIAVLSGGVGVAGMLPFSRVASRMLGGPSIAEVLAGELGRFVAFSIGMMIRIVGTVALFLLCRYHMTTGTTQLAAWVLGWYVYLTIVEVAFFVCLSPHKHESADCCR